MFIVVVGRTPDFPIRCDLQIVSWRVNDIIVIIRIRGRHQINVNYGGPFNWVKLAMIRVDEWPVFIDEVIFVVFGWEWFVMFHKAIPVWRSNIERFVIVLRKKIETTSIADAISTGCFYMLGVVWFETPVFRTVIRV